MNVVFSFDGLFTLLVILAFGAFALFLSRVLDKELAEKDLQSFSSLQARENFFRRKREAKTC